MVRVTPLVSAALLSFAAIEGVIANSRDSQKPFKYSSSFQDACTQIETAISSVSAVYYSPSAEYNANMMYWASSSSQLAACSVEPGSAQDVGVILGIIGATRTAFAVKGGGHASNPGFSSTKGVQIAMRRFNQVIVNKQAMLVEIGAGLKWDDVYQALDKTGLNVVGGRVSGVGVAGFTLGGGYSWKSDQYGLTIDTVESFELVRPNGQVQTVTSKDEDLFFALKGGFNNFVLRVMSFTL